MEAVGPVLKVAGPLLQGVGGLRAGKANQAIYDAQAREELIAGNAQALRVRDAARKAIGEQVAASFSNGFMGGSGSALDALTESQINAAMDAMTVRREAAMKARSLQAEGAQAASRGSMALAEGLLGSAGALYGMRDDWAQARRGTSAGRPAAGGGDIVVSRGASAPWGL